MAAILVTGGAGFIGSNLVRKLLNSRHRIIVIDNLSTGKLSNLELDNPRLIFIKTDINRDLENVFSRYKPSIVFHLAAQIDVRLSMSNPLLDAKINILGSLNVLELARKFKVNKIIYSSTGGVIYGSPKKIPVSEDYPSSPICAYGLSKYIIEEYLRLYYQSYGLKYIVLRYGNVYGPGQNPKSEAGVIAIFINQLLSAKQPILYDNGLQKRDYVYIDDIVKANLLAIKKDVCGVFNIGTGKATSAKQILKKIERLLSIKVKPLLAPKRLGEIKQISLNSNLAKRTLGWQAETSLSAGLKNTINYFKKNYEDFNHRRSWFYRLPFYL